MNRITRFFSAPKESPLIVADPDEGPGKWGMFEGPLFGIPAGRNALYLIYGDPGVTYGRDGTVKVSREWERANCVITRGLPGYAKPLYVHRLVEPYLREGMRRAAIAAPSYLIRTLGCFAPRHQRHDRSRPLSDHTWACAFDINASTNKPNTVGDMPPEFVECFTSLGFEWGGQWKSFKDPMHLQLRRT